MTNVILHTMQYNGNRIVAVVLQNNNIGHCSSSTGEEKITPCEMTDLSVYGYLHLHSFVQDVSSGS